MMSPPPAFLEMMLGFKQKIDDGLVPKSAFPNIQEILANELFTVETMKRKSNAAAGLTDFIININVYNDINDNVEPMRIAQATATEELSQAVAAKEAALAAKKLAEDTVAELTAAFNNAIAEKEAVEADFKVLVDLIILLSPIFLKISLVTLAVVPREEPAIEVMI